MRVSSRGATIEDSHKTAIHRHKSWAHQSLNAVASRLTFVRMALPGTRVPGFKISSHPRLKPTPLRPCKNIRCQGPVAIGERL